MVNWLVGWLVHNNLRVQNVNRTKNYFLNNLILVIKFEKPCVGLSNSQQYSYSRSILPRNTIEKTECNKLGQEARPVSQTEWYSSTG